MRARVALILTILGLAMAVTVSPASAGQAFVSITKTDTPDPVLPGGILTYTIVVTDCPLCMPGIVQVNDSIPAGTSFQSATATEGIIALNPGLVNWNNVSLQGGESATLTLTVLVDPGTPPGTIIQNTATLNQLTALAETTVAAPPTPAASNLPNAAMVEPNSTSSLAAVGFAVLLIGALGVLAVVSSRRAVSRR